MHMKRIAIALIAIAAAAPSWAVYKCKDDKGQITYQHHPCNATGTTGGEINAAPAITTGNETTTAAEDRLQSAKEYNRRFDAAVNGQVMRGMSAKQVEMAWGPPSRINDSIGAYGRHEQWVYYRGSGRAQYVYLENGVVTAIQSN